MKHPDFSAIYSDPIDAACCAGYWAGSRRDSPEPSSNDHPAYVHGFLNGREDAGIQRRGDTAQERRDKLAAIRAMLK